jgi:hypothetical protein
MQCADRTNESAMMRAVHRLMIGYIDDSQNLTNRVNDVLS